MNTFTNDVLKCCPTKAYISYSALEYNYNTLRSLLPEGCGFVGVVKSNAYGHGAIEIARKLEQWDCEYLAVANLAEALELRNAGISSPILILGITAPEHTKTLIDNNLTQTIADNATAKAYSQRAIKLGKSLKCHLKLDTGMGRIGFFSLKGGESDISNACTAVRELNLSYEGVFTHFSTSDVGEDGGNTKTQFAAFVSAVDAIEAATGRKFRLRHCANSGATVCYPETHLDMVRPGIALYGYAPANPAGIKLRPVMTVKSRVAQLRTPAPESGISYGRTYITKGGEKLAVIPMGYNDGLFRLLSNKISFACRGKMMPQVGRICMDMCMADASAVGGIQVGDEVTVFGENAMNAEEMAESIGTISYELLCAMDRRVGRVYID